MGMEKIQRSFIYFPFNKSRLKYSTGQKVPPKYWNTEKQRVKLVREFRQAESINNLLDKLDGDVCNCYRDLLLEGATPTPELIRVRLSEVLKKEDSSTKDLADFAEKVLEASNRKEGQKEPLNKQLRLICQSSLAIFSFGLLNLKLKYFSKNILPQYFCLFLYGGIGLALICKQ